MKSKIILVIFLLASTKAFSQGKFLERFNFEVAVNYSTFLNKSNLDSIFFPPVIVFEESNLWRPNYNVSLGYKISKGYNLRIKYSRLDIHRRIDGATYNIGGDDSCCYPTYWPSLNERIVNSSLSLVNEFNVNLNRINLLGTIELAKQTFDRSGTVFYLQGMQNVNYALAYSVGVQKFFTKHFSSILRVSSTNTLFGKDEFADNSDTGSFLPVSYGVELGCRFQISTR